jgi:quinol monooxygenase YgiN
MKPKRREVLASGPGLAALGCGGRAVAHGGGNMHDLIGKMRAAAGQRDALVAILLEGTGGTPGCPSYVAATDPANADAIWITEVWDSRESHDASLRLPAVQAAIARARPIVAGFDSSAGTVPAGGIGLPR